MLRRDYSNAIKERAKNELGETSAIIDDCLTHVNKWRKEHPQFNSERDHRWYVNYIRGCEFNTLKIISMLEAFFKLKESIPELICNKDPLLPDVQDVLQNGVLIPFGSPDIDCVLFRWEGIDLSTTTFAKLLKVGLMMYEIFLKESDTAMIVGQCVIIDCNGMSFANITPSLLSNVRKIIHHVFISVPTRIKHFYIINCNSVIRILYKIFKPIFPSHIQNIVGFYGKDYSDIFQAVPQTYFPKEYGGDNRSMTVITDEWKAELINHRDWLLKTE